MSAAGEQLPAAGSGTRERGEAGLTLVELLISVAIMGVAFAVIVSGMFTYVTTASSHRTQANAGLYARQYAEAITNAAYVSCAATYGGLPYAPPVGYTATNSVMIWNDYTSAFSVTPASCTGADDRMQRVRIDVVSPSGYTASVDVVKRAP